jgi:hypothetical protein
VSHENNNPKGEGLTLVSYLLAAVILIPVGWWLKANLLSEKELGYYILSLGGLLY